MSETIDGVNLSAEPVRNAPRPLADQVAIVTGASRGIGQATAIALARMGATVVVNHKRNPDRADIVCAEITGEGGTAVRRCRVRAWVHGLWGDGNAGGAAV